MWMFIFLGGDLKLDIKNSDDSITIQYGYTDTFHNEAFNPHEDYSADRIEQVLFTDGTLWELPELLQRANAFDANEVMGTSGDDTLDSGIGEDSYFYGLDDGDDRLRDSGYSNGAEGEIDRVYFSEEIKPEDVGFTLYGPHLELTFANSTDSLTIDRWLNEYGNIEQLIFSLLMVRCGMCILPMVPSKVVAIIYYKTLLFRL